MSERWKLVLLVGAFALAFFLPIESPRMQGALLEGFWLLKDYARQHVLLCLVPAFFIAGAIGQFVSQGAVLRYLGAKAPRPVAYGVASVSGQHPRRLLLHRAAALRLDLPAGGRPRPGDGLPLLGPGDQRPRHDPHRARAGPAARARARDRRGPASPWSSASLMALLFRREEAERQRNGADPFAAAAAAAEHGRGSRGRTPPSSAPWWRSSSSPTGVRRTRPWASSPPSTASTGRSPRRCSSRSSG